jgi:hypothetical protein
MSCGEKCPDVRFGVSSASKRISGATMGEQNVPISVFKLKTDDFTRYGRPIGALGLSTLFVLEGGYAVNVLQEFA